MNSFKSGRMERAERCRGGTDYSPPLVSPTHDEHPCTLPLCVEMEMHLTVESSDGALFPEFHCQVQ